MSILRAVVELNACDEAGWWPVTVGAAYRMAVLDGELPPGEIGAFLQQLAEQCRPEGDDDASDDATDGAASAADAVRWIIAAEESAICGGLRAEDGAGTRIDPGCCADLADWREWAGFAERSQLWLGHDPDPWADYRGDCLRLQPCGGMGAGEPCATGFIDFSFAELPDLLRAVQRDLVAFLDAVGLWARHVVPDQAADLVRALDAQIGIGRPLW